MYARKGIRKESSCSATAWHTSLFAHACHMRSERLEAWHIKITPHELFSHSTETNLTAESSIPRNTPTGRTKLHGAHKLTRRRSPPQFRCACDNTNQSSSRDLGTACQHPLHHSQRWFARLPTRPPPPRDQEHHLRDDNFAKTRYLLCQ